MAISRLSIAKFLELVSEFKDSHECVLFCKQNAFEASNTMEAVKFWRSIALKIENNGEYLRNRFAVVRKQLSTGQRFSL